MLAGLRDKLIRRRTQLANNIRGCAAAFGLVAAKGLERAEKLLSRTRTDPGVPDFCRTWCADCLPGLRKTTQRLRRA